MRTKYYRQMWNARRRGIEWALSFEDWKQLWEDSGKWEERGRGPGQYVMGRKNDTGPYALGNVEIQSSSANRKVYWETKRLAEDPFRTVERTSAWDIPGWKWTEKFSLERA